MTSFSRVPVVDVHNDNLSEIWPSLVLAMSSSTFIALDTELSGLGHRKKLNAKSIEDRYKNISETAKSRSIISLGLSCFKQISLPCSVSSQSNSSATSQSGSCYIVQTFNILLLCEEEYVVEPMSLKFLVQHGFDFNKQYEKGISYYRGVDRENDHSIKSVRHLFRELISMKVPIVLHNGLVDMMFMYENLYTSLPTSSATFLADLVDMFPGGVIDTKYITDFEHLMQASYLEYVFRKCQKDNEKMAPCSCTVNFPHYPASYHHVTYRNCSLKPDFDIGSNEQAYKDALCGSYAGHGWCSKGPFCDKSHDIDLIIDVDDHLKGRKSRKRKRRNENKRNKTDGSDNDSVTMETDQQSSILETEDIDVVRDDIHSGNGAEQLPETDDKTDTNVQEILAKSIKSSTATHANGGHRAGYDAFMTGFIYAVFLHQAQREKGTNKIQERKNKLYLGGKDYPLSVSKSSFIKQSKQHLEKIGIIRQTRLP